MATTYTSLLGLALPTTGELQGTWGDTVNNAITSLLDSAVAGTTTLSTDGDVTLTTTTGAANQARQAILLCSGARTAQRTITAPAQSKIYTVINNTTGGYAVKLVGVGPTTGVTVPAGSSGTFAWNGSDFVDVSNYVSGNKVINGNLTVNGNTTLGDASGDSVTINAGTTTFVQGTANGVLYLNGSKVATSGSALTFDGSQFGVLRGSTGTLASFNGRSFDTALLVTGAGSSGNSIGDSSNNALINFNSPNGLLQFYANGSEQMRLTSTGLGIGTSSPAYKLDLNGSFRISNGTNPYIALYNGSNTGYVQVASGNLDLIPPSGGNTTVSSGNLGLGVTPSASTAKQFEIGYVGQGLSSRSGILNFVNGATYNSGWKFTGSTPVSQMELYNGTVAWYLSTNTPSAGTGVSFTQAMTLDASGNLLVGGTASTDRVMIQGSNANGLYVGNSASVSGVQTVKIHLAPVNAFSTNWSTYEPAYIAAVTNSNSADTNLVFATYSIGATTERARIYSDGNMALGYSSTSINGFTVGNYSYTTAYAADLGANAADFGYGSSLNVWAQSDTATISGITLATRSTGRSRWDILNVWTSTYLGDLVLRYRSGGTSTAEAMRITSSGIVGIGTNSPGTYSTKLSINGNSTARMMNIDNAGANGVNVGFSNNGTDIGFLGSAKWVTNGTLTDFAIGSVNNLIFAQNGNERARINGSGYVTIGSSSTQSNMLRLTGANANTTSTAQFVVCNTTQQTRLSIAADQSVNAVYYIAGGSLTNPAHVWCNNDTYAQESMRLSSAGSLNLPSGNYTASYTMSSGYNDAFVFVNNDSTSGTYSTMKMGATTVASAGPFGAPANSTYLVNDSGGRSAVAMFIGSYGPMIFGTNGAAGGEKMRIDTSGNLLVGTTTLYPAALGGTNVSIVSSSNGAHLGLKGASGSGANIYFSDTNVSAVESIFGHITTVTALQARTGGSGGVQLSSGATSWSAISDERLKDIIEPITNATQKVSSLRSVIGKYKTDNDSVRRSFLIAQDVQAVLPEAVSTTKASKEDETDYLTVAYTDVIPLLVAAIKEQQAIIESLKARLDAANF